jgi:hypothetical protein
MEWKPNAPTREVPMRRYAAMSLILGLLDQESPIAVDDARDQVWLSALFRF